MRFKKGDRVETLDDAIIGKVEVINGSIVTIKDDDGFAFDFESHELILIEKKSEVNLASFGDLSAHEITKQKATNKSKSSIRTKPKYRSKASFVVDLHIHQLTDTTKGMSNFDMLNLQVDTARRQLEFAISKRIPKMVFVHGVGKDVLRQELVTLLSRYNNVEFYDADFKTYGLGATEVRIFQNVAP